MKKLNLLFTALMLVCCIGMAKAHDFSVSGIYYSISSFTNKTVKVTYLGTYHDEYYEYFGSVVIPESVNYNGKTYSVTSIGQSAFYGCYGLTSITIPNSVTSIEEWAFYGCSGLTSVTIGNSVKSIEGDAFYGCEGLTSITIPNSVKSIEYKAFYGCSGLTSITIPNSVTSIGDDAFYGCTSLKTVINFSKFTFSKRSSNYGYVAYYADKVYNAPNSFIDGDYIWFENEGTMTLAGYIGDAAELTLPAVYNGKSVTSVGKNAFSECENLTKITIPNSVASIGESAFYGCSGLTSITIPNSVTSIGESAFYGCSGLTSITIPNSVTSIGDYAFNYCNAIKEVHISDIAAWCGIDFGSYYANPLYYAKNLYLNGELVTELVIPEGVKEIKNYAFSYCSELTSITIPNSVTSIGRFAFDDTAWYNSQPDGVVYAGKVLYRYKGTMPSNTSITIKEGTLSITDYAFSYCDGLTSITIPNSVKSIGNKAFRGCSGLTSIIIGNSVEGIGESAFEGCTGLTSITIPNSVKSIGKSAFRGCSGLTSIIIGNSVEGIGESAFEGCTGLTSITIPNSVTFIGDYAFYKCTGLISITIPNSVKSIGYQVFYNCTALKEMHINDLAAWCGIDFGSYYANPLYYAKNLYLNGELVTELVIPEGVKEIKNYAFSYCDGLTSITIPNSVKSIGNNAFRGCSGLTSIIIGNSVEGIGESAFYGCTGLTNVELPNSVKSIGDSAFGDCSGLNSITIPNSVTSIGNYAFDDCTGLTSITIPNSVTSIGSSAFSNCSGLTSVTSLIPADELFAIDSYVFYKVDKTTCTLYVPYGAKETYAAKGGWKAFSKIVEMEPVGLPGDINKDGEVNVGDFAALVNIIINSESIDDTTKSVSDINADGEVNVGDFAALVNLIFNSGSQASPQRAATRAATDETTFYIEPFSIAAGDTKVIPVLMENPGEKFSQLQFDITLPEGLEIPEYFDEEQFDDVKDIKRGSRTKSVYSIQTQPVGEALRVLCITQNSKATFNGESGDVLLITVKAADEMAIGDVEIKIANTVLSRQDGTTCKPADCTATISVTEGPTTGIDEMKEQKTESKDVYYDLSGRAVENPAKGINILNGKKVLVK